jgi:hypothetical protein
MNCQTVQRFLSEYLDGRLSGVVRTRVAQHLSRCAECEADFQEFAGNRTVLRAVPMEQVPAELQMRLRVDASRELARWKSTRTLPLTLRSWTQNLRLAADNLMRPLALPFAGGVVSALFLFALLLPSLGFKPPVRNDVPIAFYTAATLVSVPGFGINNAETVVMLYVDDRGQAMDYAVERGALTPEMQSDLTQMMMFSRFTPATWFGQPTNGKVLVSFRRINYVVHG